MHACIRIRACACLRLLEFTTAFLKLSVVSAVQDAEAVQRLPGNSQSGTRQLRDYTQPAVLPRATQPPTSQQSSPLATSRASISGAMPTTIPAVSYTHLTLPTILLV